MPGNQTASSEQGDIFDSAVNLEASHFQEGWDEGFNEGIHLGKAEAKEVGLKSGFETGEEIGFYRGCVEIWKVAVERDPSSFSARVQRSIHHFDEQLHAYPLMNPEDETVQDLIAALRAKFKAILSMLSVRLDYPGYANSISAGETSF